MPYSGTSKRNGLLLRLINAERTIYFRTGFRLLDQLFEPCLDVMTGQHYVVRNFRQIASFIRDIPPVKSPWIIVPDLKNDCIGKEKGRDLWIGIHPGGNIEFNDARQWPLDHFVHLIEQLGSVSRKFILFGKGEHEKSGIGQLIKDHRNSCIAITDCDLSRASQYLRECDLFVGNDSGIMNLAVGLGVPTVAILGPTDPAHTGPYGKMHRIARLELDCSPCFDRGYSKRCKHRRCLTELQPEYVAAKVEELLHQIVTRH